MSSDTALLLKRLDEATSQLARLNARMAEVASELSAQTQVVEAYVVALSAVDPTPGGSSANAPIGGRSV